MRLRALSAIALTSALVVGTTAPALADSAKPGASMTHLKTVPRLASALEGAGVVIYVKGGATASVIGSSIGADDGQVVMHIPITGKKRGVKHLGSVIVFYNTANNQQAELANPVIDLEKGVVRANVQGGERQVKVLRITNAAELRPEVTKDRAAGLRTTKYVGVQFALASGVAGTLVSLLGLPEGSLPDRAAIATGDVTLNSRLR